MIFDEFTVFPLTRQMKVYPWTKLNEAVLVEDSKKTGNLLLMKVCEGL